MIHIKKPVLEGGASTGNKHEKPESKKSGPPSIQIGL